MALKSIMGVVLWCFFFEYVYQCFFWFYAFYFTSFFMFFQFFLALFHIILLFFWQISLYFLPFFVDILPFLIIQNFTLIPFFHVPPIRYLYFVSGLCYNTFAYIPLAFFVMDCLYWKLSLPVRAFLL